MTRDPLPQSSYGVIDRYLEERGREYFAWQGQSGVECARYNKHIWQPYIADRDDILDFGCGGGFLLKVLDGKRKVGVEVNPHARAVALASGLEVYADVADVPGEFDKVISSHALEHVPHPRQAILDLKAKLNGPEARLLLLLPLDDWRSRSQKRYHAADINMHLYAWTPQTLGNLAASCALQVREVRVIQHAWPPWHDKLWKVSPALFHSTAYVWSGLKKQRQLLAIASLA
jgi:SAM-dependent methyltransferase